MIISKIANREYPDTYRLFVTKKEFEILQKIVEAQQSFTNVERNNL